MHQAMQHLSDIQFGATEKEYEAQTKNLFHRSKNRRQTTIYRDMSHKECLANCFPSSSLTFTVSLVQRARNHLVLLDVAVVWNGSNSSCNLQTRQGLLECILSYKKPNHL